MSQVAPASARDLLLGVSMGGDGRNLALLDQFHDDVGEWPATWSIWSQWGSSATRAFPLDTIEDVVARDPDIVPIVWWEPYAPGKGFSAQGKWARYKKILAGDHDEYIEAWAQAAANYGGRFILRLAHEANGHWFPWGIGNFDNTVKNFKRAWRYVHDKFRDAGADNVEFLWSVTIQRCRQCNPFSQVYPGNASVDWAGITAFNWAKRGRWQSMTEILEGAVRHMRRVTRKKIIVAETASHFRPGDKARWIRKGYPQVYARWPFIKAVAYLNVDLRSIDHPDWRLSRPNDGSALEAYADISAMAKFQGTLPAP
jgi:mannan endo-1,4-beta-mannosidase